MLQNTFFYYVKDDLLSCKRPLMTMVLSLMQNTELYNTLIFKRLRISDVLRKILMFCRICFEHGYSERFK